MNQDHHPSPPGLGHGLGPVRVMTHCGAEMKGQREVQEKLLGVCGWLALIFVI